MRNLIGPTYNAEGFPSAEVRKFPSTEMRNLIGPTLISAESFLSAEVRNLIGPTLARNTNGPT